MKKPIKDYITKLEKMADTLRELRESDVNSCGEENGDEPCPCNIFDQAIDHIEAAQQTLKCL